MANYCARKPLIYLNVKLFVRLIRPTLFSKKQINNQRQNNAHDQHRHNRDEHKTFFVLNADIAGQPTKPANQPGCIADRKSDKNQHNPNNCNHFSCRHNFSPFVSLTVIIWSLETQYLKTAC
jgi:hypothetical protein